MSIREILKIKTREAEIEGLGKVHVARLTIKLYRQIKPLLDKADEKMDELVATILREPDGSPVFANKDEAADDIDLMQARSIIEAFCKKNGLDKDAGKSAAGN